MKRWVASALVFDSVLLLVRDIADMLYRLLHIVHLRVRNARQGEDVVIYGDGDPIVLTSQSRMFSIGLVLYRMRVTGSRGADLGAANHKTEITKLNAKNIYMFCKRDQSDQASLLCCREAWMPQTVLHSLSSSGHSYARGQGEYLP